MPGAHAYAQASNEELVPGQRPAISVHLKTAVYKLFNCVVEIFT
jgi:hypothetical protein